MPIGLAVASVAGGLAQASAAKKAAKSQTQAANNDIAFQTETRDIVRGDFQPYRDIGSNALAGYKYEMGLGDRPDNYAGFQQTPGYQFQLQQGQDSINALAGTRGGLFSGRTLQDLSTFNQGVANQEYGTYMSRLGGLIDTGASAAGMSGNASQNAAAGVSNALAARGNAAAAGAVGVGNAVSGMINNGGFSVAVWSNNSGVPGAVISGGSLSGVSDPSSTGLFSYTASAATLSPSTTYWVVASVPSGPGSVYQWTYAGSLTQNDTAPGWSIDGQFAYRTGSVWVAQDSLEAPFMMSIEATAVPEPAEFASIAGIAGLLGAGWLRRRRQV